MSRVPAISVGQIRGTLDAIPRILSSHTPTPLNDWTKLAEWLDGSRILIECDDATGLAYGGLPQVFAFDGELAACDG